MPKPFLPWVNADKAASLALAGQRIKGISAQIAVQRCPKPIGYVLAVLPIRGTSAPTVEIKESNGNA